MLILNAEIWQKGIADVRIAKGKISAIGELEPHAGERLIDAMGGALLPGLWDHHIHLAATAAAQASVQCGPPDVMDEVALSQALCEASGSGWLRGIGYHESVAGMLTRNQLDAWVPQRPLRIQHRSGRMWFLNSAAIDELLAKASQPESLDIATGQLFDTDDWLRAAIGSGPPDLRPLSSELASYGITGVTEISPSNDIDTVNWLADEQARGSLSQHCMLAGKPSLSDCQLPNGIVLGPVKMHLHENDLGDIDEAIAFVAEAHRLGRAIAVHCTTETELVFALAAIESAGPRAGDRIEHAGVADDHLVGEIAWLDLQVVSQPNFIAERGDRYLEDVEPRHRDHLYRLRGFTDAGVTLAAGSDAPYGSTDPWAAMRAAVSRRTAGGRTIGVDEMLTPEQAVGLFLADPQDLPRQREVAVGEIADLCLLDRPWNDARARLLAEDVRATLIGGKLVHARIDENVDETPLERGLCAETAA